MLENNLNRPRVGIGIFVFKDGRVLLGKRKGSHAPGMYAGPGGHDESRALRFVTNRYRSWTNREGIWNIWNPSKIVLKER